MIIYKTTNLINGMIYVGKDSNDNHNYLGSGKILKRAIQKYGKENFKKETLEICDLSNINEREKFWIKELDSRNPKIGYNIQEGGEGVGCGESNPMFGKFGSANPHFGRKRSLEACKNMSLNHVSVKGENNPRFNKKHSEEAKIKMITNHQNFSGENNPMFGRRHSKETTLKIATKVKEWHQKRRDHGTL